MTKTSAMLAVAIKYKNAGFSVIPLEGKIPSVPWKEYQGRYPNDQELETWFSDGTKNIGIVTGEISGITVIDVDAKSGGLETLKELNLPPTWIVKTGGGGWHYYYKYDPRIQQTAGVYQGIDIRNDGGQVVAAPSLHQSGKRYEWTLKEGEMAEFPINLFTPKELIKKDWSSVFTKGASNGTRNSTAATMFGKLLGMFRPEEWETTVWQTVLGWNLKNNPPLTEKELRSVYESIAKKQLNKEPKEFVVKKDYTLRYTWGTRGLDTAMAIIKRGNFIVLASRSNSGKTTYVFDMACKNAIKGHKVLFLSLEMNVEDIKEDFARKYAGITIAEELDYLIPEEKQKAFNKKITEIENIENLKISGVRRSGDVKWSDIEEIIKDNGETDMVFVDNLDLISAENKESENDRQKRITKCSLNFTATTLIPLVMIHHYRKQSNAKGAKDFGMDEMTGSGKIKDGADRVLKTIRNQDPEALYPEKFKTTIHLQKGRGYPENIRSVYFIRGTFVDNPPTEEDYKSSHEEEEITNLFNDDIPY